MRHLVGLVFFLLALGTLRVVGCGDESPCGDCNDYNPCTRDYCEPYSETLDFSFACDREDTSYRCKHSPLEDGAACGGGVCIEGRCVAVDEAFSCTEQGILDAIAIGGGPYTFDCGSPTTVVTTDTIVIDNDVILDGEGNLRVEASRGHVFSVSSFATAELIGVTITGGGSRDGGGIVIYRTGTLTLTNCTVSGNTASFRGGGIGNEGNLTLTNCTVSGNSAEYGGGISNTGMLTLTNTTVSGNDALLETGGIRNQGTMTMTNCTVSGNSGGDVYTDYAKDSRLEGSVVDGDCTFFEPQSSVLSNGYNIESPGNTCGFDTKKGDQVDVTAAELNLGPLQDNGGPTDTHEPGGGGGSGSFAIDQIPEADCAVSIDQRGQRRPETGGTMCDVGAFEVQP